MFFITWIKHNRNATKAYLELHSDVDEATAGVLGSKMLGNIKIDTVLSAYGLGHEKYFEQLKEGLGATKWNDFTGEREADHKTRLPYHDKLGKIIGVEHGEQTLIQQNIGKVYVELPRRKTREEEIVDAVA